MRIRRVKIKRRGRDRWRVILILRVVQRLKVKREIMVGSNEEKWEIVIWCREIIVYYRSTINTYSLLSYEWWVLLIKYMVGPSINVKWGITHLWYFENT